MIESFSKNIHYILSILYEKIGNLNDKNVCLHVEVQFDKIQQVKNRYHDHTLTSHPEWKEMFRSIRHKFFWKGLKHSIKKM